MPKIKAKPMWRPEAVGEVIAEREFALTSSSGRKARVRVQFGKPVQVKRASQREPWWCPVEVKGGGLDSFRPVPGDDSLQALILALELASTVLPDEVERAGFKIEWLGDSERLVLARHALSRKLENTMLSLFGILRNVALTLSSNEGEERRVTEALRMIVDAAQRGDLPRGKKRVRKSA